MGKKNTVSWKKVAVQYNLWAKNAGLAAILASRTFGEIPLGLLTQTFGKHSLFLDEKAGLAGLYLGNFSIVFNLVAERGSLSSPRVIELPKTLSEAPSGLRDLYLAVGENFVGHNLGGRLSTISSHPEKTGEVVFTYEKEADPSAAADLTDGSDDTKVFRQIWQVLRSASAASRHANADPEGGEGEVGADAGNGPGASTSSRSSRSAPVRTLPRHSDSSARVGVFAMSTDRSGAFPQKVRAAPARTSFRPYAMAAPRDREFPWRIR